MIFKRTSSLVEDGISTGLHLGVQGFISLGDEEWTFASGENRPGEPLTNDHLMLWLSSGKPVTAAAILKLVEAGELNLNTSVASVIPEFAQAGKEQITLQQILTHTSGLKPIITGWPQKSWDEIIQKICSASQQRNWEQSSQAAYDPSRSWFILGEIIRRITSLPVEDYVRREILEPAGMNNSWLALPEEIYDSHPIGQIHATAGGDPSPSAAHTREACTRPSPGGSMRGPVRELGRFYQVLLHGGATANGIQILKESTVSRMTHRHREGKHDETFQHVVDFGLGVIVNSNRYGIETVPYGFGRHSSDTAFGHGGAQSSVGFADPERDLVVVIAANGTPGEPAHQVRFRELISAVYEDLEIT